MVADTPYILSSVSVKVNYYYLFQVKSIELLTSIFPLF